MVGKLIVMVLPLQKTIESFTNQNKLLKSSANYLKFLLVDEYTKNGELVRVGKEAMTPLQERETKLTALEEEKLQLTCRLYAVSDAVTDKEEYYQGLLKKRKAGVDKTIEDAASGR